jgi:hypothetical protein
MTRASTTLLAIAVSTGLGVFVVVSARHRSNPSRTPEATMLGSTRSTRAIGAAGAAAPRPPATFEVASATGTVEAQRDGRWIEIKRGDTLTRSDVVRTAAGAAAVLRLDAGTEIELRAGVEIGLDRLPGGASVDLRRGKVLARVNMADALAITAHETRTTSEGPARFVVLADEQGRVSVAALEGKARFSAAGKSVALPAGTASSSQSGSPPEDPERIPEEVLLNVVWPSGERHGSDVEIAGRAAPTSVVSINGTAAPVGADGRFTATVPLHEGKNVVNVEAEDLAGRTRRDGNVLLRRSPHPPKLTPEATDLWK